MRYEECRPKAAEGCPDCVEVLRTLGQNQHLAALREGVTHLGGEGLGPALIVGKMPEDVLDAGVLRQIDPDMAGPSHHLQVVRRSGRRGRRVADRPALHEDDRLLAVASDRGRRQAKHIFELGPLEDCVEGDCADMVALLDDHVAVALDQRGHIPLAGQGLHHGNVDSANGLGFAVADIYDRGRGVGR